MQTRLAKICHPCDSSIPGVGPAEFSSNPDQDTPVCSPSDPEELDYLLQVCFDDVLQCLAPTLIRHT